jgi:hypothetical protein
MLKITSLIIGLITLITPQLAAIPALAATPPPTSKTNNTPNSGQALEIAPPVINLTANPGQTIKTQIFLRDISSSSLIVTGEANDFVAAGEDGTPKVLLKDEGNNPYSLKAWIAPPAGLSLVPREIKSLTVTINVPANASPGGHYGIIRFTGRAPSLQGTGVSLSASLGSLILLTVNGKVNENLSVKEFSVNHDGKAGKLFQGGPFNFIERLVNNGNVHEQPVGQVVIKNMFGKKFAAVNVNLPPKNILPDSTRRFEEPLDSSVIGNKKLFGHYTATLSVTYGKDKKVLTSSTSFWVIPYRLVAIIIIALIAGFFALRLLIRRYNRYILNRSDRPHRR